MKLDESITCPYCEHKDRYIFYDDTDMIECSKCGKPMDIELKTVVKIISTKPMRKCYICGKEFESDSAYDKEVKCPNCGSINDNWKVK